MASHFARPSLSRLTGGSARLRTGTALLAAAALLAGVMAVGQHPAGAAGPVAQSDGTFLTGAVAGNPLADIVSVQPATATNNGGAQAVDTHPLDVGALNAVDVPLGSGVNLLGDNGILQLGAVGQYAEANPDGSSRSASGAVTNNGGIAVGGSNDFPSDATLDLSQLIGSGQSNALGNLTLAAGALSASAAQGADGAQTGDYQIAGLKIGATSPLISQLTAGLRQQLVALQPTVDGLPAAIRAAVGPVAAVSGVPNLAAIVDQLGDVTTADGSIKANLSTGALSIDVAKVLATAGLDLNNLPVDTELLPYITDALTHQLLPALTDAFNGLSQKLTDALNGIDVTVLGVPVSSTVLAPVLDPVIAQLVAPVNTAVAGLGDNVITPLATALTDLLSLQANVQETAGGKFTERALRLRLVPDNSPAVAVVNLASASVGPNAGPSAPVAPTTSGLDPNHGPAAGGQTVTVTGTGFVAGDTSVTIGATTVPASQVTVTSDTSLTFATPAHDPGPVGVTVTTPGGTSTPALTYTYEAASAVVPTASGLDPTHGPATGGQTVTVTGSGFVSGDTSVTIGGITIPALAVTVSSPTQLTFPTPPHLPGAVGVTVTTPGGTSDPALTYTYDPAAAVAPTTSGLDPNHGPAAGGQTVTVTGTNFIPLATSVTIGGSTVPATEVTVTSPTSLTFTTPANAPGAVSVTVTTPGGTSSPALSYTYDPAAAVPPTTSGLNPTHGPAAGGQTVTVTGTGFVPGDTSVTIGTTTIPASEVTVTSGTTLTFTTPVHVPGAVPVTVTTAGGTSGPALTYTYDPAAAVAPTTSGLNPKHGPAAGGQTVTVTGTGFVPGSTTVTIGGTKIPASEVTVTSGTTLTFTTPAHDPGDVNVTVTTPGGTSDPALGYTYDDNGGSGTAPTAAGLDPSHGPAAGGQKVTITGSGFVPGSTTVTIGGTTIPASKVTVVSSTELTFTTPAHDPGRVQVTTTTDGGTSDPLPYTYDKTKTTGPVITDPTDGSTTTDPKPVVSGTGTAGDGITVSEGGNTLCTTTVRDDNSWSCRPSDALSAGAHRIVATETAADGTLVGRSDPVRFSVNPVTPSSNGSGGSLAQTGLTIASIVMLAIVLAGAGVSMLLAGRRRREA